MRRAIFITFALLTTIAKEQECREHHYKTWMHLVNTYTFKFQNGVGIGLPLSRSIVRQLGGDITLDTAHHPGARFVLTLPL